MPENKQARNYLEMKIKTASPIQLIIMLYEKAISLLEQSVSILENNEKKLDIVNNNIVRTQEILSELMLALDFDKGKEIAQNLYTLYDYALKQCIEGNIKKDPQILKAVIKILSELKLGWEAISGRENDFSSNKETRRHDGSSFNVSV